MKKRSEEIAEEIKQNEEQYEKLIEEGRKAIELNYLPEDKEKTKREIILEAGKLLEKNQYIKDFISARLKQSFKGVIAPRLINEICPPEWKQRQYDPRRGKNRTSPKRGYSTTTKESLTPQQQEYVQAHEDEIKRDQQVAELIQSLTNKTIAEQGEIIGRGHHGRDFRKELLEESKPYMLKVAKQMITSDISTTLWDHRTLRYLSDGFCDILYEEQELRKKKKHLESA